MAALDAVAIGAAVGLLDGLLEGLLDGLLLGLLLGLLDGLLLGLLDGLLLGLLDGDWPIWLKALAAWPSDWADACCEGAALEGELDVIDWAACPCACEACVRAPVAC